MTTTTDEDVTTEAATPPTKRQRRAASIADAASGGIRTILIKMVLIGIVDAIALYAVFILALAGEWVVLGVVAVVTIVVNWIYFSRTKLPAK